MSCNSYFIATHGSILLDQYGTPLTQRINPNALSKFKGNVYFVTFTNPGKFTDLEDRRLLTYYIAMYGSEFVEELTEFLKWLPDESNDIEIAREFLSSTHYKGIYKYATQILNVINSTVRKVGGVENTKSLINVFSKNNLPYNFILENNVIDEAYFAMSVPEATYYDIDRTHEFYVQNPVTGVVTTERSSLIDESRIDPNIKYVGGITDSISKLTTVDIMSFMSGRLGNTDWARTAFVDNQIRMKIPMVLYHVCDDKYIVDPGLENVWIGSDRSYMYLDNAISNMINTQNAPIKTLEDFILRVSDMFTDDVEHDVYFVIPSCQLIEPTPLSPGGTRIATTLSPGGTRIVPVTPVVNPSIISSVISRLPTASRTRRMQYTQELPTLTKVSPTYRPSIRVSSRRPVGKYTGRIIEVTYDYNSMMENRDFIGFIRKAFESCFPSMGYMWNPRPDFNLVTYYKRRGTRGTPDFMFEYCKTNTGYYIYGVCGTHLLGWPYKRIPDFVRACMSEWISAHRDSDIVLGVSSKNKIDTFKRLIRLYSSVGFLISSRESLSCTIGPFQYDHMNVKMGISKYRDLEQPDMENDLSDASLEYLYTQAQNVNHLCMQPVQITTRIEPLTIPQTPGVREIPTPIYTGPVGTYYTNIPKRTSRYTPISRQSISRNVIPVRTAPPSAPVPSIVSQEDDVIISQGGWSGII